MLVAPGELSDFSDREKTRFQVGYIRGRHLPIWHTSSVYLAHFQGSFKTDLKFPSTSYCFLANLSGRMASDTELTPMMAQYRRIKGELPKDALLLFRLGDFYELFFEDAQIGAQLLNVALTRRGAVPMCGIPFHAAGGYVSKLLKAGRKIAICDQMEEARFGQLVKREVTQILSPGTHFDERMLSAERNNYLAAICAVGKIFGLAFVDLTTGDFKTSELENQAALLTELERLRPAEIIYPAKTRRSPHGFPDATHTGPLPGGDRTQTSR